MNPVYPIPRVRKPLRGLLYLGLAVFLSLPAPVLSLENHAVKGPKKELPMLVSVGDLADHPEEYDGRRVVVTGLISSMEIQTGRRGSEYLMIVLEDDSAASPAKVKPVQVFSLTRPKVQVGEPALVQGVYHKEGRQAGRNFDHFVDAEVILRN
ncbi:MAG TPA: hypothetical protein VI702_00540 [Nitrospiria bacterium]